MRKNMQCIDFVIIGEGVVNLFNAAAVTIE